MASSDKVVVNAEHIAEHGGSLKRAMELWSSRNGPVNYNTWQSLYFALLRDHGLIDEDVVAGESQSDMQKRIRARYHEIQSEVHGPDHLAQSILAQAKRNAEGKEDAGLPAVDIGTSADAGESRGRATAPILPGRAGESRTNARPPAKAAPRVAYDFQQYQLATPRDLEQERVQNRSQIRSGSPGAEWLRGADIRGLDTFQYETRPTSPGATSQGSLPSGGQPDRLLHLPGAGECWSEDGCTHTEATAEQEERLARYASQLHGLEGSTPDGVEFCLQVDQLIPEYREMYGEWVSEDRETRVGEPIKVFALEKLSELDAEQFEEEYELKRHVYALGRLANRTMPQSF